MRYSAFLAAGMLVSLAATCAAQPAILPAGADTQDRKNIQLTPLINLIGGRTPVYVANIGISGGSPQILGESIRQLVSFNIDREQFGLGIAAAQRKFAGQTTTTYYEKPPKSGQMIAFKTKEGRVDLGRALRGGTGTVSVWPNDDLKPEMTYVGVIESKHITTYEGYGVGYDVKDDRGQTLFFVIQADTSEFKYESPLKREALVLVDRDGTTQAEAEKNILALSGSVDVVKSLKGGTKALADEEARKEQYRDKVDRGSPIHATFTLDLAAGFKDWFPGFAQRAGRGVAELQLKDSTLSSERLDGESKLQLKYADIRHSHTALTGGAVPMFAAFDSDQDGTTMNITVGVGYSRYLFAKKSTPQSYKSFANAPVLKLMIEGVGPIKAFQEVDPFNRLFSGRLHLQFNSAKYAPPGEKRYFVDFKLDAWRLQRITSLTPRLYETSADIGLTVKVNDSIGVRFGYVTGADPTNKFERKAGAFTFEVVDITK